MEKKILHLIPTLSGGGAERQLVNVVCNTSEEYIHFVCTFSDSGFYAPLIREKGYEVCELEITGKRPWLSASSKFASVVRKFEPDLINTWLYHANITGRIAKLRGGFKTPLVTSLQATDYEPETIRAGNWSPKKVEVLRQIDKMTVRLTKPFFVACSQFVQKSFEKWLNINPNQIRVIHNAVNPEALNHEPDEPNKVREQLGIPPDSFVFLNVGRLDPQKNQARILQAFAQILPSVQNAFLIIIGVGPLETELKNEAKMLGIEKNVRFAGRRKDIGACLSAADVFLFPSLFEGLPLALIEAMFKSLPCIAGDIEVLREVVTNNETGLLINPQNANAITEAMLKLYKHPDLRRRLGLNGLATAEKDFHAKTKAVEWEDFYQYIIDSKQ